MLGRGLVVVVLLGGLTSYAQGLPDKPSSFANSVSGWTVLTAMLVAWSRLPASRRLSRQPPASCRSCAATPGAAELRVVAALAGIGLGDAIHGLAAVRDTTSPVYLSLIGLASLALLAGMLARRIRGRTAVGIVGSTAIAGTQRSPLLSDKATALGGLDHVHRRSRTGSVDALDEALDPSEVAGTKVGRGSRASRRTAA